MQRIDRRRFLLSTISLAAGGALTAGVSPARAQGNFPDKPMRIVVPGPPGGGTDLLGRSLAVGMGRVMGQQVIVDNKAGASGIIAAQNVLASPADGYTMYLGFTSMIQLPALMPNIPVNFSKDFTPVSLMALGSDLLAVSSKLPVKSVPELIALAKSKPGQLSIGSYGSGTSSHLHGELLKMRTGIDLIHVPYKGAAPMLQDLLGGQLDLAFVDQSTANAQLKSDRLRFIAMTGTQHFKPLPQLKTLGELGYSGFESNGFMGMFVAAGTPAPIVAKLSSVIAAQVRGPEITQRLADMGMEPVGSTPEELLALMTRDSPRWAKIVKDANIRLD
ncbi:tripartite tricarboxylate transporter substrate binding protein [Variovorax sp. Sphag1AA]|uniref:Bug family tripartite tricarboxylate transporter substrate binding protein n=1 Tax=Variovorax sp. Sphag1AA TaxID=2587027 RepID=UPI0016220118|nr:tripartite tricarboxylate transporter substrate binding protein [Variovorax sp. Sphag1AA]MBB3176637.1 tripartite-type tricarboxylate transporter receptor subunit TctC [Variovorax sp. Sphag1AA]